MENEIKIPKEISDTVVKVSSLMKGSKRVILQHGEKPYLLSITRRGKLILTLNEAINEN